MDKISIIVVGKSDTLKGKVLFMNFMASLYDVETLKPYNRTPIEIINVDDYAVDGELSRSIKQPKPFNYNACLNAGVRESTGEYLYLCNNDLVFTSSITCGRAILVYSNLLWLLNITTILFIYYILIFAGFPTNVSPTISLLDITTAPIPIVV